MQGNMQRQNQGQQMNRNMQGQNQGQQMNRNMQGQNQGQPQNGNDQQMMQELQRMSPENNRRYQNYMNAQNMAQEQQLLQVQNQMMVQNGIAQTSENPLFFAPLSNEEITNFLSLRKNKLGKEKTKQ